MTVQTVAAGPLEPIDRLANRVQGGTVVFFIGAGFSIDSENNTAQRLIARLLARLLALGTCLAPERFGDKDSEGRTILDALGSVFALPEAKRRRDEPHQPGRCMTRENVALLAREYYTFNEWSVSALGVLAREMQDLGEGRRREVAARVHSLENLLVAMVGDPVPLDDVDWACLGNGENFTTDAERGKALFLDTMGFANPEIMAGRPSAQDLDAVADSYRGRLRPRHHALARLAREGLLPCVVTTNYDLLLEGAYRLAGFRDRAQISSTTVEALPATAVPSYSRIAGAVQFFAGGESYRTALLLKIHGCAENYAKARSQTRERQPLVDRAWASYLPALVFTYREIQTWRADAWSRDLLRTLLRTNTLALCGYSTADPVMHSTFREVYEEMSHLAEPRSERNINEAPLFFFDVAGKREFHGLEILRAATEAMGRSCRQERLTEHPNRVEFQIGSGRFPSVDDHLCWLLHRVLRRQQEDALRDHLRRVASRLLGYPCPDSEYKRIRERFEAVCAAEKQEVERSAMSEDARAARAAFDSAVGWTWNFLPGLLRECALGEFILGQQGPGRTVRSARRGWWYFPASERPEWTAWAAVVELALRQMVDIWRGPPAADEDPPWRWIAAEGSPYATVSFSSGKQEPQPTALSIRLSGFARSARSLRPHGAYRRITVWELGEQDIPWRTSKSESELCPDAAAIWSYALGERLPRERTAHHLGVPDGRH